MTRAENREVLEQFFSRLCFEFGDQQARAVFQVLVEEVGGMRLTVPSLRDLERSERDRRIRKEFTGFNHQELALRFGLSVSQIRRVVNNH